MNFYFSYPRICQTLTYILRKSKQSTDFIAMIVASEETLLTLRPYFQMCKYGVPRPRCSQSQKADSAEKDRKIKLNFFFDNVGLPLTDRLTL